MFADTRRTRRLAHAPSAAPGILALALWVLVAGACGGDARGAAGALGFVVGPDGSDPERPYFHDFGNVPDGERVEHVYLLHNGAARDVAILDVVPGCGCTVPSLLYRGSDGEVVEGSPVRPGGSSPSSPLLVLPPGRTAELRLRIDTAKVHPKNTQRLYTTRLTTDLEASAYLTVETGLLVEAPFQVVPERLDLGQVPMGGGGEGSVRVSVLSGYDLQLAGDVQVEGDFEVELRPGEAFGHRYWDVVARLAPPVGAGRTTGTATLGTLAKDGGPGPALRIGISAYGVPDVRADPARLIVVTDAAGEVLRGGSAELFSLLAGERLRVVAASVDPEHAAQLAASFAPLEPDGRGRSARWSIALAPLAPLETDVLSGTLTIALERPDPLEVELPYVVHRR